MGQVATSELGSSRACSPRPSPPTVHCLTPYPPIVRTANVLCARSLPYPWSSRPLQKGGGYNDRGKCLHLFGTLGRGLVLPTLMTGGAHQCG